jgi:alginate O-acetyltransferase complex protein AlgI
MSISGLWHGASYNHLIWGCGHGVIMVIERLSGVYKTRQHPFFDYLRMIWVFAMVALLFIPFRAESTEQLMILMDKLLSLKWSDLYFWIADNRYKNYVFGILLLLIYDFVHRRKRSEAPVPATIAARSYSITFLILLIILLGTPGGEQFIYFQF